MSISSKQIKEAAGALSLQVVQNEVKIGNTVNQSKSCTSLTRRKCVVRELRNLECNIDYGIGGKVRGPRNDT